MRSEISQRKMNILWHHSLSEKYKWKPQWDTTSHLSEWWKLTTGNRGCQGWKKRRILLLCWWECKLVQPLWRTVWRFLQKLKNRTILWLSKCTTRYLSKEYKNTDSKGHMHPNVYSSTINNSQIMERAQMSIDWWMDKEDVVHTHTHKIGRASCRERVSSPV